MPTKSMTDDHKEALATGRTESRAVKLYLDALENTKPKRGRKRTAESIEKRLHRIDELMPNASAIEALNMRQERLDLTAESKAMGESHDLEEIEAAFVKVAASYGDRKGITYPVWREAGVPDEVLGRAGITRR